MTRQKKTRIIMLAVTVAGFLLIGKTVSIPLLNFLYSSRGKKTTANVSSSSHSSGRPLSWVKYKFVTETGQEYNGHENGYFEPVGGPISIEYLSYAPSVNRVSGSGSRESQSWRLIVGLIAGFFFVLIGNLIRMGQIVIP